MNFKFNYNINNNIPQGAWCTVITEANPIIQVEMGKSVFISDNFFVFGIWDGDFEKGDFVSSNYACCTGAMLTNVNGGGVIFSTPSHLLETIYGIKRNNQIFLSNSLPFLLKRAKTELDPNYLHYQRDMGSSIFGFNNQTLESPLKNSEKLLYFRYCNFEIYKDLSIVRHNKSSNFIFKSYEDYLSAVKSVFNKLKLNAIDPKRSLPYNFVTTISKGYDAPASSAIAKDFGCETAFTFNAPVKYSVDSGDKIAETLGYKTIIKQNADFYLDKISSSSMGKICTGYLCPDELDAFSGIFKDSVLITGARGFSICNKNKTTANNEMDFSSGNDMQVLDHSNVEMNLEHNIVIVSIPLIGGDKWKDIHMISNSSSMKFWSVGGSYDRPIPRRILEEKGISRSDFGQNKMGMGKSIHFDNYKRIKEKLSDSDAMSLSQYKKKFKQNFLRKLWHSFRFYSKEYPWYFNYASSKLGLPLRLKTKMNYYSSPHSTLLITWAVNKRMLDYPEPPEGNNNRLS